MSLPVTPHDATEKRAGYDADDRVRLPVQRERATDDIRRRAEMGPPESIAENHDTRPSGGILLREKHAPQRGSGAHDLEKVRSHRSRKEGFRFAAFCQRELPEPVDGHALEQLRVALPVVKVGRRNGEPRHTGECVLRGCMEQPDESAGFLERQRPQQHRIDDAEDGRVGTDAQCKDCNDRKRKRRRAGEDPQRVTEVGHECAHDGGSP